MTLRVTYIYHNDEVFQINDTELRRAIVGPHDYVWQQLQLRHLGPAPEPTKPVRKFDL